MKLILTREVAGLGNPGDVVNVKDGYARNFLLPRGSAIAWSKGGETQIDGIRKARQNREIRDKIMPMKLRQRLKKQTLKSKQRSEQLVAFLVQ